MENSMQNPERTQFGEKQVTPEEKTGLVRGVFDSVADNYDIMNDLMSGGVHRLWKDRLISMIRPKPGEKFLDVAGGTGDIAFRIRRKTGPDTDITVFDLNQHMLSVGRDRAIDQGWVKDFTWTTGNAESLPFPDNSFDVYTIAFGLRNVTHIDTALTEAARVLKPGGRFYCLEFGQVDHPLLGRAYDTYSRLIIPKIGKYVAKDEESYQYLIESIRKFPKRADLCARMQEAGINHAKATPLSGGIVNIHNGTKSNIRALS
jgi:demethylmenaquinone methyltransferase/2-methoxy-6-polyprenyl-1,4-benzoquinol methylase